MGTEFSCVTRCRHARAFGFLARLKVRSQGEVLVEAIDVTGGNLGRQIEVEFLPQALPIAHDECGNFWRWTCLKGDGLAARLLLLPRCSGTAGAAGNVAEFVREVLELYMRPHESMVEEVRVT